MHRVQPLPAVVVEVAVTPPAQDLRNSNHNNNHNNNSSTVHLGGGVQREGQLRQGAVQAPGAVALVVGVEGEPLARAGVLVTAVSTLAPWSHGHLQGGDVPVRHPAVGWPPHRVRHHPLVPGVA